MHTPIITQTQKNTNMLKMSPPLLLILSLQLSALIASSDACGIAVYWGRNRNEGTLRDACSPKSDYNYVAIAFLTASPETPVLDLDGHCDPELGNCKSLRSDIEYCQSRGIKVFLSVDASFGRYSPDVAPQLAQYVYNDFLGGGRGGPLGNVVLDGVDLFIDTSNATGFWPAFAKVLSGFTTQRGKVYLSAAPKCTLQNNVYQDTIKTGLLDYVWVQFYKNAECDIRSGVSGVLAAWKDWSAYLAENSPASDLFMGLPASPDVDDGSYIYPCVLEPEILPALRKTPNYGGLMVWNRLYDMQNGFSPVVVGPACEGPHEQLLLSQVV